MAPSPLQRAAAGAVAVASSIAISSIARAQAAPSPYPSLAPKYAPADPPPLETGGLTPPPTTPLPAGESTTVNQLERAEREDAGRGLEFVWVEADAGYEYISLQTFQANALLDAEVVEDQGSAFAFGLGAGVRLIFLTLGARFRLAQFSDWDLWTLNGEVGLHVPLGVLEPAFTFGAGYASLGALDLGGNAALDPDRIDVSGFDVRLGAELNWYVNPLLSLGVRGSGELLVLYRNGAAPGPTPNEQEAARVYERDGDGIGIAVSASGVVGLHF